MKTFDFVVCGAGPAGLSAARKASALGLKVLLIDEQSHPGGQIYREVNAADDRRRNILGADYAYGEQLTKLPASIEYITEAKIWRIEKNCRVIFSQAGNTNSIKAKKILLAFGALERSVPIPGWTLPGVMGVGAAQILLKSSSTVPKNSLLAGSGPLLYLFAAQLVRSGYPPIALIETQSVQDYFRAIVHVRGAFTGMHQLRKGLSLISEIKAAGVTRYLGADQLAVLGSQTACGLRFKHKGKTIEVDAQTILLHQGVVPNIQASMGLGLAHRWHQRLQCFEPITNEYGRSSHIDIYIAGDGAGIVGAIAAEAGGAIAALDAACALGVLSSHDAKTQQKPYQKKLAAERAFRPFIEELYPPPPQIQSPADHVLLCRCEEVSAGEIRLAAKNGAMGVNQLKAFTRAGMGPCQGRYCGLIVNKVLSQTLGQDPLKTGYYRIRPPLKPVSLGELATLDQENYDD